MRVLQLVKTAVGATWAYRQMRELVRLGVDVHVATPDGPLVQAYRDAGVHVHLVQTDWPVRSPQAAPATVLRFRRLVDQVTPQIIHSHFVGTTLTMRLALGRVHPIARVFQVPGPLHLESRVFGRAEMATAGPADWWIASCEWTRRLYCDAGIPRDRVHLSYYGTDFGRLERQPPGRLRAELGLAPTTRIAGMVAYMYAPKWYLGQRRGLKGHEDFIDAVRLCRQQGQNLVGVIVGGAWGGARWYEQRVHEYAAKRDERAIRFLGNRDDIASLYADFDVAVHPSHSENVGGALESLLLEVPTIASNIGGFPDLVKPDVTGWLVPPRNPTVLARTIAEVLHDPHRARTLARQGARLARDLFDVRQTARQIRDIYDQITTQQSGDQESLHAE